MSCSDYLRFGDPRASTTWATFTVSVVVRNVYDEVSFEVRAVWRTLRREHTFMKYIYESRIFNDIQNTCICMLYSFWPCTIYMYMCHFQKIHVQYTNTVFWINFMYKIHYFLKIFRKIETKFLKFQLNEIILYLYLLKKQFWTDFQI